MMPPLNEAAPGSSGRGARGWALALASQRVQDAVLLHGG